MRLPRIRPSRGGAKSRGSSETAHEAHIRIGQLAKATGIQVETIRFYEREGLLPKAQGRMQTTGCTRTPMWIGLLSSGIADCWTCR
jgi:hypothetical protein